MESDRGKSMEAPLEGAHVEAIARFEVQKVARRAKLEEIARGSSGEKLFVFFPLAFGTVFAMVVVSKSGGNEMLLPFVLTVVGLITGVIGRTHRRIDAMMELREMDRSKAESGRELE